MKYNLGILHKPDSHTSTHLHKKKTVWKERQTGEEYKTKPSVQCLIWFNLDWLVTIFSGVVC